MGNYLTPTDTQGLLTKHLMRNCQDLIGLKFSRQHETEADAEGLKALVAAGIAPAGMRDFFRKMGEKEKLNLGWLSSHPASEERYAAIDTALKALPPAALQAAPLAHDYQKIKQALPAPPKPADPSGGWK